METTTRSRINNIFFEPHPDIKGSRSRQQTRYLSIMSLLGIPVLVVAQHMTDISEGIVYLIVAAAYFVVYIFSRTSHYNIAVSIALIASCIIPLFLFLDGTGWIPTDMPRLFVWLTFTILVSALFAKPRYIVLLTIVISLVLGYVALYVFYLPLSEIIEFFLMQMIITALVMASAVMLHEYADKTQKQNTDLEKRRWELEVYSQLLRHDIRNDLQVLLGSIELAEMLWGVNEEEAQKRLVTSLKIGQSIIGLLNAFSMFSYDMGFGFVRSLEAITLQAQDSYEGLQIKVKSSAESRKLDCARSRLMPMVWMNIFRNAAQHAGPEPEVLIVVEVGETDFQITIEDNGPGVSDEDAEWLFVRGTQEESDKRGMGLYLARTILESHGGSIRLIDNAGCKLGIRLPFQLES
ncbi:MAG: sensor histidine kinase [Candidatus Thorarchaeota archaeon]|jgi:signal transduction histidine kinase